MAVAAGLVIIASLFGLHGCEATSASFVRVIRVIRGSFFFAAKLKDDPRIKRIARTKLRRSFASQQTIQTDTDRKDNDQSHGNCHTVGRIQCDNAQFPATRHCDLSNVLEVSANF
jgi:hypothetical protein